MIEPVWIQKARSFIGTTEVKGPQHNPTILKFWKSARLSGIKNDEVPWCAGFACAMLEDSGIKSPRMDGARAFVGWGQPIKEPVYGCIVVFVRDGGGHVGFCVGKDDKGNLLILGGNQSDAVNIKSFPRERAIAFRYPPDLTPPSEPLRVGSAALSTTEA